MEDGEEGRKDEEGVAPPLSCLRCSAELKQLALGNDRSGAFRMSQQVEALATKPAHLSIAPSSMVEGKSQSLKAVVL